MSGERGQTPAASGPHIAVEMVDIALVIKINGVVHLWIDDRRKIVCVHSWRVKKISRWFIEYTLEGGAEITSDYDSEAKWKAVLAGLAVVLPQGGSA